MPFKKGQSGNNEKKFTSVNQPLKNGRPKGKSITTILKEILDCEAPKSIINNDYITAYIEKYSKGRKLSHRETIVLKLLHNAEALGDMRAIIEILDRTEGKIKESIEHSGEIKTDYSNISTEELERRAKAKMILENE